MKKVSYVLLTILSLTAPINAIVYIVPDGTTENNTITLPDEGDSLIIEKGGAIEPPATDDGVDMTMDNQTTLNRGRISTQDAVQCINSTGMNAVIINRGIITAEGLGSGGIQSSGTHAVIINRGIISASRVGIITTNPSMNSEIINSGIISVQEVGANGIALSGSNEMITNSGIISIQRDAANGIVINGSNEMITNSGVISIQGDEANGILCAGSNIEVTNSGIISAQGDNTNGIDILSNSNNSHIINSGTIRAASGENAILVEEENPTVSLLRGSNLQGLVTSVNNLLNLNVETGLNLALSLNPTGVGFGNLGIAAPFALLDEFTIGVIDPTGLAMQADIVADLSDTILDGIYRHRTGFSLCCVPCGCEVWAQGIGSSRSRSHDKDFVGYDNWQGGFLVGFNTYLCGGYGGIFGGVSFGEATVDQHTQRANTTSYVAGLSYEWLVCNSFVGVAIAAGYIDWDNDRFVMNNLASDGVEKATFDTGGAFVSPEITLAHSFCSIWCNPSLSLTLRYAGLFLGDYHETGSLTNLSVKDREIDLLTTRFEVALPYTAGRCCWSMEPYVGVYGRYQVGGCHVKAELFEQTLSFDPGSPDNLVAFLLGFRGVQSMGCFNLFLNIEASFDNYSSSRILGEGGVSFSF